jgi:WD40 repeat protein/HEAT repeat protein/tRNA A-37 threonylcarbamoyl transferase component Bud32
LLALELHYRRAVGESPELNQYRERFPDYLSAVADAFPTVDSRSPTDRPPAPADQPPPPSPRALHIRCPHCRNPIEVLDDTPLAEIVCPSCGSNFSLIGDEALAFQSEGGSLHRRQAFGHFELIEQLGTGAFGAVWKARDTKLDRTVALKIPRKGQLSPEEAEKFVREARAAAQLQHPGIVSVYEVGREGDTLYIVSEFVEGLPLADWLTGQRPTYRESAELCIKIADALHHAHEHGVIHRDLKPSNVLLDRAGEPHVMDFGLAKREAGEITMTVEGQVLGTPAYMSPEQAKGEGHGADRRTDVYSLGVILFELLTGERPFRGNMRMLLKQVIEDEPLSPRKLDSRIPRDLETIALKCMQKEPHRRYATAQEVAEELRCHLENKPIHARPIGRIARTWRWCRRYPVVSAMGLALLVVLVSGTVISTYFGIAACGERDRADANAGRALEKAAELEASLYMHQIALAHQAWLAHDAARAREILDACPIALRHWEWDYLNRVCHLELATFSGHRGPVIGAAFSPDGKRVITLGRERIDFDADTSVRTWDANSAKELRILGAAKQRFRCLASTRDGKLLVTGGDDVIVVWSNDTGERLFSLENGGAGPVQSIAFSPDGKQVASGHLGGVLIWDLPSENASRRASARGKDAVTSLTERALRRFDGGHRELLCTGWARSLAFSPDGNRVAVATQRPGTETPYNVTIYDVRTGNQTLVLPRHSYGVNQLAFRPDGKQFALAGDDGIVRLCDTTIGREALILRGHTGSVESVAYARDGKVIASGGTSDDKTIRLWNAQSGEALLTLCGHANLISSVEFSADGMRIVSASDDGTAKVWSTSLDQVVQVLPGHSDSVCKVTFSPRGDQFASAAMDGTVKTWDSKNGCQQLSLSAHSTGDRDDPQGKIVTCLAYDRDGTRMISACYDRTIKVWDVASGQLLDKFRRTAPQASYSTAFLGDGRIVAGGRTESTVQVWDLEQGKTILQVPGTGNGVVGLSVSPDDSRIATGGRDGTLRVCDAASGHEIRSLKGNQGIVRTIVFSPDGTRMCSAGEDGTVIVWSTATWAPTLTLRGRLRGVAYSPDGKRIVTTDQSGTLRIWDTERGLELLALRGPAGGVGCIAFSPDGQQILAGSHHRIVRWDSGKPRLPQKTEALPQDKGVAQGNRQEVAVASRREPKYEGKTLSYWATRTKDRAREVRLETVAALESIGRSGIPTLVELVRDKDEVVSKRAALALGAMGPRGVPVLIELLHDDSPAVRGHAAESLAKIGCEADAVVPALAAALHDTSPRVRYYAAAALCEIGREAKAAVSALADSLHDPDANVRRLAVRALGRIGPSAKSAVPALVTLLRESLSRGGGDDPAERAVPFTLLEIGPVAMPFLTDVAVKEKHIGETEVKALAEESPAVGPVLMRLLGDSDPWVRMAALIALKTTTREVIRVGCGIAAPIRRGVRGAFWRSALCA